MKLTVLIPLVSWLLAMLFIQGCSSSAVYRRPPPPVIEQGHPAPHQQPVMRPNVVRTVPSRPLPPVKTRQSPAVVALLDRAELQANTGELESAAVSLERAIRIDPRNPVLWYHLASIRLSQDDPAQAEQLATKSNSLAAGKLLQQVRNWRLIAQSRRQQGNKAGAAAAERRARDLESR